MASRLIVVVVLNQELRSDRIIKKVLIIIRTLQMFVFFLHLYRPMKISYFDLPVEDIFITALF